MRRSTGRLAGLVLALACAAGAATAKESPKPLFAENAPLRLTLKGPINELARGSRAPGKEVAATLSVQGGAPETLPVTLSVRGITRRMTDICAFPPLRVEFPDKAGGGSLFKGQKRLKLVTHCRASEGFQQYVLLEYAAYRLYNQLTPLSFDVRLANIDYVDAAGKPMTSRVGFFIEDIDDVAKRNGLSRVKTKGRLSVAQLNAPDAARFALFQYLIGNLDWAMTAGPAGSDCCHNSRPLAAEGATTAVRPTPYDFDFSGLVDAPYATPPEGIKVPNVRTRVYRGFCAHSDQVRSAAADLTARRGALLGVLDGVPQLEARARQKAAAYLGDGFDRIATPGDVDKLLAGCLKGGSS